MAAGSSKYPIELLQDAGVDMTSSEPFNCRDARDEPGSWTRWKASTRGAPSSEQRAAQKRFDLRWPEATRATTAQPATPEAAVLERVPNPHPRKVYLARFAAPEFTSLCPITGQPDFAHLVIDYAPAKWLVESKSLKLYLGSFRNHGAFHEDCTLAIADGWLTSWARAGFASAATGTRAAACRSTCSGKPGVPGRLVGAGPGRAAVSRSWLMASRSRRGRALQNDNFHFCSTGVTS
jgi:7-cyano-7-deazaguanine reductase